MINVSLVSLVVIVQLIIFLILAIIVLSFLLRSKKNELNKQRHALKSYKEISPLSSVEYYFTAEIKLTESRFSQSFTNEDLKGEVFGEPDWLLLRKNFLELEKELLLSKETIDSFWVDTGNKFKSILEQSQLVKRIKIREVGDSDEKDELKEMKQLLKSQYDDFDALFLELDGEKSNVEVEGIREKLSSIMRNHTELSHCIYILEDENLFLRDQIKGLVD